MEDKSQQFMNVKFENDMVSTISKSTSLYISILTHTVYIQSIFKFTKLNNIAFKSSIIIG